MFNTQLIISYFQHLLKAKTRHGIHSPFTYRLVDEIIYDFRANPDYKKIEDLRRDLEHDQRMISITDLGAGSYVNNRREKQLKSLAKNALKPAKLAQLIYRLAADLKPANIIELGTCLGLTTAYLASAAPDAQLISIEGCPKTAAIAKENLARLGIRHAEIKVGNFDTVLPQVIAGMPQLDFVFVDGNHRKDATLNYFEWCLPKVSENSMLIFDDIYWSKGMKEAWQQIKDHPDVTLTVDLFWIGLVFFKKGRVKENFRIRF